MTSDELKLAAEYNRGWQDSKKAKSADEWRLARDREDVVRKLLDVKLEGGSHANLSEICKCVYPADEWTPSACVGLRDELVGLLGGGDASSAPLSTYDTLDNERHKAVRKLAESRPLLGMSKVEILCDLGKAVTNDPNFDPSEIGHLDLMWNTLIHLLGGDGFNFSTAEDDKELNVTDKEPSLNELYGTGIEGKRISDEVWRLANDLIIDPDWMLWSNNTMVKKLRAIAKRIDAQFDRICEQQERVLQDTIDQMCGECDKLQAAIDLKDRALDAALAKLKDSIELPKDRDDVAIHAGDAVYGHGGKYRVKQLTLWENGEWSIMNELGICTKDVTAFTHTKPSPTAESIVRDLTLGLITEKEAVRRIEGLRNE